MSDAEIKVGSRWKRCVDGWAGRGAECVVDDFAYDIVRYSIVTGSKRGENHSSVVDTFLSFYRPVESAPPPSAAPPAHYDFAIQPRHAIREWKLGFALGNVVKYVVRADRKGTPLEDLEKARDYLADEITERRKGAAK